MSGAAGAGAAGAAAAAAAAATFCHRTRLSQFPLPCFTRREHHTKSKQYCTRVFDFTSHCIEVGWIGGD